MVFSDNSILPSLSGSNILDWLRVVSESGEAHLDDPRLSSHAPPEQTLTWKKRKMADDNYDDVERTPRQQKKPRSCRGATGTDATILPPTEFTSSEAGESLSSVASSPTRSTSPSKRKRWLKFATPSIDFEPRWNFDGSRSQLESRSPQLRELLVAVSDANQFLPHDLMPFIESHRDRLCHEVLRPSVSHLPQFATLEPFLKQTLADVRKCAKNSADESMWTDSVVLPVLKKAAELSGTGVEVTSVKTTNIAPSRLLPVFNDGKTSIGKACVDYVMGYNLPDEGVLARIRDYSVSQSDSNETIAKQVLFAAVEVKVNTNQDDGMRQLGTWCGAGYKKLAELTLRHPGDLPLPATQCFWAWKQDMVTLHVSVEVRGDAIKVYEIASWSTSSAESLLRLIMTLVALNRCAQRYYVPWLEGYL